MKCLTQITRNHLISEWHRVKSRAVPLDVMLTTAEMEDGSNTPWGFYNVTAFRYEKQAHLRAIAARDEGSDKWHSYGYTADDWSSFGFFQIMGFNLQSSEKMLIGMHRAICLRTQYGDLTREQLIDTSIALQCVIYDRIMSRHIAKRGLPIAFKRYNGGGAMANAYMQKAIGFHERACADLGLPKPIYA